MNLIVLCYSKRGAYLLNTSNDKEGMFLIAAMFDNAMVEAVARVAQAAQVTPVIQLLVNLPQTYAGFGAQEVGGMAVESGHLRGGMRAVAFIVESCTPEQIQELTKFINTDTILGTYQHLEGETGIENVDYATMTAETVSKTMWTGRDRANKHVSLSLITELSEKEETRQHAAALLSKTGSVGCRYITNNTGIGFDTFFPPKEYVAVLRHHLGLDVTNYEPRLRTRPQGGTVYDTASNPSEPLVDVLNQRLRTMRHTAMERMLAAAMRKMRHRDVIETEKEVGSIVTVNEGRSDNVSPVIADITWRNGAERVVVEISVVVYRKEKEGEIKKSQ
jgi:hypothetical protein